MRGARGHRRCRAVRALRWMRDFAPCSALAHRRLRHTAAPLQGILRPPVRCAGRARARCRACRETFRANRAPVRADRVGNRCARPLEAAYARPAAARSTSRATLSRSARTWARPRWRRAARTSCLRAEGARFAPVGRGRAAQLRTAGCVVGGRHGGVRARWRTSLRARGAAGVGASGRGRQRAGARLPLSSRVEIPVKTHEHISRCRYLIAVCAYKAQAQADASSMNHGEWKTVPGAALQACWNGWNLDGPVVWKEGSLVQINMCAGQQRWGRATYKKARRLHREQRDYDFVDEPVTSSLSSPSLHSGVFERLYGYPKHERLNPERWRR